MAAATVTKITYPKVRRGEIVEELHGVEVADPYRWLEDPNSEETRTFVEEQNIVTQKVFDQIPFVQETKNRMTELFDYEKYSCPYKRGGKYVFYKNDGLQNQDVLYIQDTLTSEPRVLLDPNLLSTDGTAALSTVSFSEAKLENGELYLAHGISRGGSDWQTIRVLAVHENNKLLEDTVEWVKFSSIAWTHDDKGFFYSRYPPPKELANVVEKDEENSKKGTETDSNLNHQLWYHRIGTPQSQDRLVYAYPFQPTYSVSGEVSDDGKYLLIYLRDGCKNANMVHVACLKENFENFMMMNDNNEYIQVIKLVNEMDFSFNYILNEEKEFYFMTNMNAPRERLVKCDLNSFDNLQNKWIEVIPEQKDQIVMEGIYPAKQNLLVLKLLKDVCHLLHVYDLQGHFVSEISLPTVGTVGISSKRMESEIFYKFISFLYPGSIFRVDLGNQDKDKCFENNFQSTLFHETKVKDFDAKQYEAKQIFYSSKDGTQIPMFLVHKKNIFLNGQNPVYLYGYGGFNISLTPSFSVSRLVFVQHYNGILALPNLRGGGEYGEEWHQQGMLLNKQNVFDDFHAASEYLIQQKYTNSSKLAIHGGSNGGLLVAACANQRPDLYRCVVGAVGVMDMLRFHKFTIGHAWRTDFGNPEMEEHFHYIYQYSPIHNVPSKVEREGGFPAVLLTTGDHDDRVVPLHSYKLIAELQHQLGDQPNQTNPLLIRIDTKSGHGAGKPTKKAIEENSEVYAFIAWNLGTKFT
jgi:prolyl oligopeptidase